MLLSIVTMLSPDAYIVSSCVPPPEDDDGKFPYSYLDTGLIDIDIFRVDDILRLFIGVMALACNSLVVYQLVFNKQSKKTLIFAGIGLLALVIIITAPTSTAEGYPNSFPFITAIAAFFASGLLLLQLFFRRIVKVTCFAIAIGALSSFPSMIKSSLITLHGVIISSLYLFSILLFYFNVKHSNSRTKAGEVME